MAEYLEKETFKSWMKENITENPMILTAIDYAPSADAEVVVRCKDCKHRYSDSWCEYVDDDDNFYCARGKRKDGDGNG